MPLDPETREKLQDLWNHPEATIFKIIGGLAIIGIVLSIF